LNNDLSTVLRALNERAALCREISEKHLRNGNLRAAEIWQRAAEETQRREETARLMVEAGWLHPEAEIEPAT
jgi:hypothetical protein